MTVIIFQPRFVKPLLDGTKRQTIRPYRRRPIRVGERLDLRRWEGTAYRSRQLPILVADCVGVFDVMIDRQAIRVGTLGAVETRRDRLDEFARRDGFGSWQEMQEFFDGRCAGYQLPFFGSLIIFQECPGDGTKKARTRARKGRAVLRP